MTSQRLRGQQLLTKAKYLPKEMVESIRIRVMEELEMESKTGNKLKSKKYDCLVS